MRKLIGLLIAVITMTGCTFATDTNTVVVRNQTYDDMQVVVLRAIYFTLKPMQEIEFEVTKEVMISTPYGVALETTNGDNTLELHEDCYYWGETKKSYWDGKL